MLLVFRNDDLCVMIQNHIGHVTLKIFHANVSKDVKLKKEASRALIAS